MESPRKFNDCYFYYYSTCTKGDNCVFRHEPSALGCETMCTAWQQGKCLDKRCKLRHMELRKNRKQIPCYWENQPGGCRKKHCPFMHKNPDARTDGIAPSQPGPPQPAGVGVGVGVGVGGAGGAESGVEGAHAGPAPAPPAPQPVPLLWQQQRQVVLDSAILGVLPGSSELLGARRVLPPHAHAHAHEAPVYQHAPHAPHAHAVPVDPLVVNFEEESDTESAPSSTPTKTVSPDERSKSRELQLLERIQAAAAALYAFDAPPSPPSLPSLPSLPSPRPPLDARDARADLDFKVLSLDEIRARKKAEAIVHQTPITLNLSRKRKLSTTETITTSGNKIIKVVRSNSIVYKKVDRTAPAAPTPNRTDQKPPEEPVSRKRTLSEMSDLYEIYDDELVDNVYEFKRIKVNEQTTKPRLIRHRSLNKDNTDTEHSKDEETDSSSKVDNDNDSDLEVQIVSVGMNDNNTDVSAILDTEIIDVESTKLGDPVAIVDLSDDSNDVAVTDLDLELVKNVPDVVASCHKTTNIIDGSGKDLLSSIDAILNDEVL